MLRLRRRCENPLCSWCHAPADWTDIAAAFVAPVLIIALAVYALAACTLHVVVRTEPVARAPMDAAVAVTPPASPGLVGDAGPCGAYSITSLSINGCTSGVYTIDADATAQLLTTSITAELDDCERARKPGCDNPCIDPLVGCANLDGTPMFNGFDGCHWRCGSWRVWEGCDEDPKATWKPCSAPHKSTFAEGPRE